MLSLSIYAFSMHHPLINPLSIRQACLNRYETNLAQLAQQGRINDAQRVGLVNRFNAARLNAQTFSNVQTAYFALIKNAQPAPFINKAQRKS